MAHGSVTKEICDRNIPRGRQADKWSQSSVLGFHCVPTVSWTITLVAERACISEMSRAPVPKSSCS